MNSGTSVLVENVIIEPSYRGKGIGKVLLKEIEIWAVTKGAKRLQLLADCENTNGLEFYKHLNWKSTNLTAFMKRNISSL